MPITKLSVLILSWGLLAGCSNLSAQDNPSGDASKKNDATPFEKTPVAIAYRSKDGNPCVPSVDVKNCAEFSNFRDSYWRFEIDQTVPLANNVRPSMAASIFEAFKKSEVVISQSFFMSQENMQLEIPISGRRFVNGDYRAETVVQSPSLLSPWILGAKSDMYDVRIAGYSTVVFDSSTHFAGLVKGALQVAAVFNVATAALVTNPAFNQGFSGVSDFERDVNAARSGNEPVPARTMQVFPRYLDSLSFYARKQDGAVSDELLFRVKVKPRSSLFISNKDDLVNIANVTSYKMYAGVETNKKDTPLISVGVYDQSTKNIQLTADGPISLEQCTAVLDGAKGFGLNDFDSAVLTAAWLSRNDWNAKFSRRDSTNACYKLIAPLLGEKNVGLLASADDLQRNDEAERKLPRQALVEFSSILKGTGTQFVDRRLANIVDVSTAEQSPAIDEYFGVDMKKQGVSLFPGDFSEAFSAGESNPLSFPQRNFCYSAIGTTSTMTIKMICVSVKEKNGDSTPYIITLSLDRDLLVDPAGARIKAVRFEKKP